MSDKTCGDRYREYVQEVTLSKEKGVKEKWLTLVQALNHWGKEELWARVQAGTILARKNPLDTRYWEFRALQQVGLTKTSHTHKSSTAPGAPQDFWEWVEFCIDRMNLPPQPMAGMPQRTPAAPQTAGPPAPAAPTTHQTCQLRLQSQRHQPQTCQKRLQSQRHQPQTCQKRLQSQRQQPHTRPRPARRGCKPKNTSPTPLRRGCKTKNTSPRPARRGCEGTSPTPRASITTSKTLGWTRQPPIPPSWDQMENVVGARSKAASWSPHSAGHTWQQDQEPAWRWSGSWWGGWGDWWRWTSHQGSEGAQEHNHPASSAAAQAAPGPTGHYSKWAWLCLAFENT